MGEKIGNINESLLKAKMIIYFRRFFYVEEEVWSTDKSKRIDLIITHKSDVQRNYPIGIEIKVDDKKRGKELAKWIIQSSEYSEKIFNKYGKCLIATCPQISGLYLREGIYMHNHESENDWGQANNIGTFLSQFNIGEVQKYIREYYKTNTRKNLLRIVYRGQIIWDQHDDRLRINNYTRLCKR